MSSSTNKVVVSEILPYIRVYDDGTVERLLNIPSVPPQLNDPQTGVSSKDITIFPDTGLSARLYLPKLSPDDHQKLPILVYFHGGSFCIDSSSSSLCHRYMSILVSRANIITVSVEYRLVPEHPLPAAYEDCWSALKWVSSNSSEDNSSPGIIHEPWLRQHGDFERVFIGGDSSGANIVHNVAMRAGLEPLCSGVKLLGAFLNQPYFTGSMPIGNEPKERMEESLEHRLWKFAFPSCEDGVDNPAINPLGPKARSLSVLGCRKMFVSVGGADSLRDRGIWYCNAVKETGWEGEIEFFETEGEGHAFHIFNPATENAQSLLYLLPFFSSGGSNLDTESCA
ncbi:Alpha/beta hydrolase fold-3 [Dillenia turbinata]|uniref:Alpha/beta hydrolase fold-3 n=1 Tax=Dillenia turbinata TaxID=194707 RepID=A0AAN8YY66_9MAGN